MEPSASDRVDCPACGRPSRLCVCDAIRRVPHRTGVTILQHPAERKHPFNTVRLARLALERVTVRVAWDIAVPRLPLPPGAALLYPGEAGIAPRDTRHLVVLDGTWPQARSLFRANPWLAELPRFALEPVEPSAYAIRREPAAHCLSSIESIAAALALCEPDNPAIPALLNGFRALVQGQLAHRSHTRARPRRPHRPQGTLLTRLARRWSDVVVLYAETCPLRGEGPVEVLQLAAYRPSTGDVFDRLARVSRVPRPVVLGHMGLGEDAVREAPPLAEVHEAWARWRRPEDLYVAWSWGAAETALRAMEHPAEVIRLKSVYCNLRRIGSGRPDQVLAREGITAPSVDARGRAATRLGNAAALARWLGDQARGAPRSTRSATTMISPEAS